jgi:hypothetical protein
VVKEALDAGEASVAVPLVALLACEGDVGVVQTQQLGDALHALAIDVMDLAVAGFDEPVAAVNVTTRGVSVWVSVWCSRRGAGTLPDDHVERAVEKDLRHLVVPEPATSPPVRLPPNGHDSKKGGGGDVRLLAGLRVGFDAQQLLRAESVQPALPCTPFPPPPSHCQSSPAGWCERVAGRGGVRR